MVMVNLLLVPAMSHHLTSSPVGVIATIKLGVSIINVFALAFGALAGSVAPVALVFTLTADTRVAFELSPMCSMVG